MVWVLKKGWFSFVCVREVCVMRLRRPLEKSPEACLSNEMDVQSTVPAPLCLCNYTFCGRLITATWVCVFVCVCCHYCVFLDKNDNLMRVTNHSIRVTFILPSCLSEDQASCDSLLFTKDFTRHGSSLSVTLGLLPLKHFWVFEFALLMVI